MYGGSSLQMPEVNSDCPPLVGVAMLDGSSLLSAVPGGSSLQKSTATVLHRWVSPFSMGHPCCLLSSVGHPPSVGVAMLYGLSLLSAVLDGLSLQKSTAAVFHREVSPCMVGYLCRCQKSIATVFHWWVSPFWWSFSIEMCRHALWVIPADARSQQRLSAVPGGLSLHREVSPCMVGYPCRCQKSTATVLHWWVSLFSMGYPCRSQ